MTHRLLYTCKYNINKKGAESMDENKKRSNFLSKINPFDYPERFIGFLSILTFVFAVPMTMHINGDLLRELANASTILFIFFGGILLLGMPAFLTVVNIIFLFVRKGSPRFEKARTKLEITTLVFGGSCTLLWSSEFTWEDYTQQLINDQVHSPIATDTAPTLIVLFIVALIGYSILRTKKLSRLSPIVTAFSISAMYLGIVLCLLWIIQVLQRDILSCLYAVNVIMIHINTTKHAVMDFTENFSDRPKPKNAVVGFAEKLLSNVIALPFVCLVLALPLLGVLVAFLALFGQAPDSIIQAWTETSDWTMSQRVSPPNLEVDMHYLCTVAASGHEKVVKPLRVGKRHGHKVIVNRQLCVANAFEQLLQEKTPKFHRAVRGAYDKYGYPIAKHIRSRFVADLIWIVMKPAEWVFLFVLYLFDSKPENRIALQYPHKPIPEIKKTH